MSINIRPSDWLNAEPDLLSLPISLKLKSPKTWTERIFFYLCVGSWYGQADFWTVESLHLYHQVAGTNLPHNEKFLFAKTLTQTDSELFSNSVMGICEISLWTSNITLPPWRFLSFLYTVHGQDCGNNSEGAMELSIFVSWIATMWGWWKSRKANNSSFFFSSNAIDV